LIFNKLGNSWEQQKGLINSLKDWHKENLTVCQHVRGLQIVVHQNLEGHFLAASAKKMLIKGCTR